MTTVRSQSISSGTLATIFASAARVAVLRVFMLDPMRMYYQRQLELATGIAIRGIQRELERLSSVELLYRHMEGNRAYYKVDTQFPIFPELRSMVLKAVDEVDRLRGHLAFEPLVRLAFRDKDGSQILVVTDGEGSPVLEGHETFDFTSVPVEEFLKQLEQQAPALDRYLAQGEDLLGRRDDIIWRRIEGAGFKVKKGKGIP